MTDTRARDPEEVVAAQRAIQREVAADDRAGAPEADEAMQAGARRYPVPPFPEQHQPKPGERGEARSGADVRRAVLEGLGQARGQGGADHRRRFRHRPGGRGALRARGRRRRDRPSRRGRRRRGDRAAVEAEGRRAIVHPRRRRRPRLLPRRRWRETVQASSAGSTCWSTTPPSRCIRADFARPDARAFRRDAEDQPLRLLPHGAGGGRRT